MQPVAVPGPDPALRFPLGLLAAVLATLVMDLVMARLPQGETPPRVAAGVLTETHPDDAHPRLASVVHYVAGLLTGPLFVYLLYATEFVLDGRSLAATLGAGAVLFVLMVAFFVGVVLPRSRARRSRRTAIVRDWALSALAYVVVAVPVVHLGSGLL
ncbi:hypothetical protein [Halosegnis marinus]|uniref:Uncharacterized protein n=1 Tax=Halosegnis marinus TaxID=3034023 RepID=A0ABD5ZM22_9EURY|nr:hypothetical protein [Halosegnis sp. DT85]